MILAVMLLALALTVVTCTRRSSVRVNPDRPLTAPSTQPLSLVGTLRGDMMAIGGETSGWVLAGDGATGGIELDVSSVAARARELEGQRVSVTGKMTDRKYVERGTVRVLVVDQIVSAPEPRR
jgi:hypothetical protein